jgi:hypothetical protein
MGKRVIALGAFIYQSQFRAGDLSHHLVRARSTNLMPDLGYFGNTKQIRERSKTRIILYSERCMGRSM